MDSKKMKSIFDDIKAYIAILCEEQNLRSTKLRCRSVGDALDINISVVEITGTTNPFLRDSGLSTEHIQQGLCKPNDIVYARDRDGLYYKARILARRRVKYSFEFVNYTDDGIYVMSFKYFKSRQDVQSFELGKGEE